MCIIKISFLYVQEISMIKTRWLISWLMMPPGAVESSYVKLTIVVCSYPLNCEEAVELFIL